MSNPVSDTKDRLEQILQEHRERHGDRRELRRGPAAITKASKEAVISVLEPLRDARISNTLSKEAAAGLWPEVYAACSQIWGGTGGINRSRRLSSLLWAIFEGALPPEETLRMVEKTPLLPKLTSAEAAYMF